MANAGVTVGSVWLDVLPSMRDFGSTLVNGTEQASRRAGERAGQALAEGTQEGAQRNQGRAVAAGAAIGSFIGNAMVSAVGKVGDLIASSIDMSASRAKLQAQLGTTAEDAAAYGRIAGELYSTAYGDSLDQVQEALVAVTRNVGELDDADLQYITSNVLNLSSAFGVDLNDATAAVGQMLKTGLAPDAATAFDVITRGFQQGVDKSGDFLDTLNEYATQFRKLGIDGATATGLLSQGLQAGARDADLVADALKEFSIRAIDGSKTTSDAYKTLGLDATAMTSQIAKGGPEASKGLQTVLDRLRGMKDPVAQSATAVELFGTQAEDLGAALYALDPSSAVAALGDVGGAADQLNETLGTTAQAQITAFMRTLQLAFVDIVGGYVIPAITTLASIIGPLLGPALSLVGGIISTVIVPALTGMGQWVQNNASWLLPLAAGFGVFVLALNAAAIATTLWGIATSVASGIVAVVRGAVIGFQVAMWLLNAAMSANPIGIIVALLVGLVAGLIVAWNTSETFRNIVLGAWEAIKVGAAAAWAGIQAFFGWLGTAASAVGSFFAAGWQVAVDVFNTVVSAISTGAQAIGAAATWLWNTILSPVLSAIGLAIRILIAVVTTILVAPFVIAFNLIGMAATALWENRIKPAFDFIAAGGQLVATFLQTYLFTPIGIALSFLGGWFSAAGSAGVSAFQTLQDGLLVVWTFILNSIFMPIVTFLQATLVPVFQFFQTSAVGAWTAVRDGVLAVWTFILNSILIPVVSFIRDQLLIAFYFYRDGAIAAWNFVRDGINAVWSFIRDSIWQPIVQFLSGILTPAFNAGRDAAVGAWNGIRDGIGAVWNFIRDSIWQPLVNFVTGTIPDAFRTAVDAIGRAWDAVKQATRAPIDAVINVVYNQGIVKVWNWVAGLVGLGTLAEYHLPGFARGGAVTGGTAGKDSVLAALMPGEYVLSKKAVNAAGGLAAIEGVHQFLKGGRAGASKNLFAMLGIPGYAEGGAVGATDSGGLSLGGLWEAVTGGISKVAGMFSSTQWGQVAVGMMKKLADGLWPALLEKVTGWFATLFVGPTGGDVGAVGGGDARAWIIAHESGGNPTARNPTSTASGLYQMINGTWKAYGGSTPTAAQASVAEQNAVADRYVAARYGTWENARAFWQTHHYYDAGGMLPTGWSSVYNGTGKPEPVLTNAQWQQIAQGTTGTDGALHERFDDLIDAVRNSRPITVEDRSGNPVETARAAQLALRLAR